MNYPHLGSADLYKAGRYREFLASCPPLQSTSAPPHVRVMLAEAAYYCGDIDNALRLTDTADADDASSRLARPRFEIIRGLVARSCGDFDSAMRHAQLGVRLAGETADAQQIAWCELKRLRILIDGCTESEISATLTNVRRRVSAAGDPRLTAVLHETVSIVEGHAGRYDEARRHIEIARSILEKHPHAWIDFSSHIDAFCVAWLECDYAAAARHLKDARKAAAVVGGKRVERIINVNQAHIALMTGDLGSAHAAFSSLLFSTTNCPERLAAVDGLARVHFAVNQRHSCEEVLRHTCEATEPRFDFYAARWARACGAALALRCGRLTDAIRLSQTELRTARARGDHPFCAMLLLLQAEAFATNGDILATSRKLLEAAECVIDFPSRQQAESYRVTGKILTGARVSHAPQLISRARRVWRREQNIWAQLASADVGEAELPISRFTQDDVDRLVPEIHACSPQTTRDAAASVLNSVVAAFDLSFDARLASAELEAIAAVTGCSEHVTFRIAGHHRGSMEMEGLTARLKTGRQEHLVLNCQASADLGSTLAASDLLCLVRRVNELARLRREERRRTSLWPDRDQQNGNDLFISEEMTAIAATAQKVAPINVPVLITGETGTGKEVLARAIHAASTRRPTLFVPFNCSAGPRDMVDAQLFGHRRGAFTGATEHAPGVVRAAAGGTLFLDEIGEAPVEVQPKLLRFIESGEIHPVGEPLPAKVDVRIIAATNVDLEAAVSSGRFREDLFYRLNIVRLHLPPLRERRVEIPVFAQHYLKRYAGEFGKGDLRLAEETVEYLLFYKWPGNVRQLANEMRRMVALAETDAVLMPEHLSPHIVASRRTMPASERQLDPNELVVRLDQPLAAATEHLERAMIPYALKHSDGRVEDAARMLGLSRKGLYLKRMRLGVEAPPSEARSA